LPFVFPKTKGDLFDLYIEIYWVTLLRSFFEVDDIGLKLMAAY